MRGSASHGIGASVTSLAGSSPAAFSSALTKASPSEERNGVNHQGLTSIRLPLRSAVVVIGESGGTMTSMQPKLFPSTM